MALKETTVAGKDEVRSLGELLDRREAELAEADLCEQEAASVAQAAAEERRRLDERARLPC